MINLVLFGPPGAGKGTQSDKLVRKYRFVHLSTGDIFRRNIKEETDLGKLAKSYMDKGQLVPDSVTIKMLESEVNKNKKAIGFIFDGFPRNAVQAKALDKFLKSKKTSIAKMIALEVTEKELKKRLLERGKTSGRPDDVDPKVIQKRIDVYHSETAPVKDHYLKLKKFSGVNGIGTIDAIFKAICKIIDELDKKPEKKKAVSKKTATVTSAKRSTGKKAKTVAKKPATKPGKPKTKKTTKKTGTNTSTKLSTSTSAKLSTSTSAKLSTSKKAVKKKTAAATSTKSGTGKKKTTKPIKRKK